MPGRQNVEEDAERKGIRKRKGAVSAELAIQAKCVAFAVIVGMATCTEALRLRIGCALGALDTTVADRPIDRR